MKIHLIVPDLGFTNWGKQISLIAPALARMGHELVVHSPRPIGGFADELTHQGIGIRTVRTPSDWLAFRRLAVQSDTFIHVFGLACWRRLTLATWGVNARIVVTLTGREKLTRFDRYLLQRSTVVVPHHQAKQTLQSQGISTKILVASQAVDLVLNRGDRAAFRHRLGLPEDAFLFVSAGRLDLPRRLFDAVWAFEILRYTNPNCHHVIIGEGADRPDTEAAARALAPDGSRVHFVGASRDVPTWLSIADVVVVSHRFGGVNVTLEAMAAGRAIVATNSPDLSAILQDKETALLAPPGDPPLIAKEMNRLMLNPELRERLASAAREAAESHAVEHVAREWERLYLDNHSVHFQHSDSENAEKVRV